jgi:hypothetical protein
VNPPENVMTTKPSLIFLLSMIFMFASSGRTAVLTHRYSFDADASDSITNANGVLQGNAVIANGALVLDGTNSSVQLPNDLFTNYNSISFEMWYADGTVSSPFSQLYNFSGSRGGMYFNLLGQGCYFFGTSSNELSLFVVPAVGGTNHLVWTQDGVSNVARIYINGTLAAQSTSFADTPAMIGSTTNNLIGAGATNVTPSNFRGSILEFRTYQGVLAPLDVAVLDAYGPDQPQLDPGILQTMRVVIPSPTGPGALFRAGVFADFSGITNVNISTQPGLVLTSDNTNVITFAPDQRLRTVALGTANISAIWQGFSNTLPVTVGVPQDIALVHRYGFNEQTNDWIVHDSVGSANGRLYINSGTFIPTKSVFSGNGEMIFSGGIYSAFSAFAALPPGIVSSLSEVTVEAWVTWTRDGSGSAYPWQRIFDFGTFTSSGIGYNYLFITPATDSASFTTKPLLHFAITTNYNTAETPRLNWTNSLPLNVTSFVAVTYSPVRGVAKLYLNGVLVSSGVATIPLSGIIDNYNFLGRSQFTPDPYFAGRYNEFRIYSGLLSDSDVAADYAAGPDSVGVDYVLHNYSTSNALAITWGITATNLVLKSSPVLGARAVWNQVTNAPILQNGRYGVIVPISEEAAYFRLQTP